MAGKGDRQKCRQLGRNRVELPLAQFPPPTVELLRAMAKAAGVAASTVQAIWKAQGLSPHRWRHFKLSNGLSTAEQKPSMGRRKSVPGWQD